jgi:hypothetical protein
VYVVGDIGYGGSLTTTFGATVKDISVGWEANQPFGKRYGVWKTAVRLACQKGSGPLP